MIDQDVRKREVLKPLQRKVTEEKYIKETFDVFKKEVQIGKATVFDDGMVAFYSSRIPSFTKVYRSLEEMKQANQKLTLRATTV